MSGEHGQRCRESALRVWSPERGETLLGRATPVPRGPCAPRQGRGRAMLLLGCLCWHCGGIDMGCAGTWCGVGPGGAHVPLPHQSEPLARPPQWPHSPP